MTSSYPSIPSAITFPLIWIQKGETSNQLVLRVSTVVFSILAAGYYVII